MDDRSIIKLFFDRDENALLQIEEKYSKYCTKLAKNITGSDEDADEVWNDTMLSAWNSIPPEDPQSLKIYLVAIARNHSLSRYRKQTAGKRGCEISVCLEEAEEFLADTKNISEDYEMRELRELLDRFLKSLPERECNIFIRRYYHCDTIPDIAKRCGIKEAHCLVILSRTRKKLKAELEKGGYVL